MEYLGFEIKDFKGIKSCSVRLDKSYGSKIYTLVGLNESGKTTILEAINYFISSDRELASVYAGGPIKTPYPSFVPKSKKLGFDGRSEISAKISLSLTDRHKIKEHIESTTQYVVDVDDIPQQTTITQYYKFLNSDFKADGREWNFNIRAKLKKRSGYKDEIIAHGNPTWLSTVNFIKEMLPSICYFPTFMFSIPSKIYIEAHADETEINFYYRRLIQDVLDSFEGNITLEKHLVDKIRNPGSDIPFDWFNFWGSDKREQVNHLLLRISSKLTEVIMNSWKRVLGGQLENKRVEVELSFDKDNQLLYLKMFIVDGSERYDVSDRSLGFRWFFCYLLFTYFRITRRGHNGILFLFDEPASNLHAGAQMELLSTFAALAGTANTVIYSTHSHYLINPRWLDAAYIVRNAAQPYGALELEFTSSGETDITAVSYKQFLSNNSDQAIYYLPILDAMEYKPAPIEMRNPAVLVEGKVDFALLSMARSSLGLSVDFIPCNGAGSMDPIISLMIGWGQAFVVMLDDDEEGRKEYARYHRDWGFDDQKIFTIAACDGIERGSSLEDVVRSLDRERIAETFNTSSIKKKHVQMYALEASAAGSEIELSNDLKQLLERLVLLCGERLAVAG